MASSNVQYQNIQTQLDALGVPSPELLNVLQNRQAALQNQIATMDKSDTVKYSAALQQLYTIQGRLAPVLTEAAQALIQEKIHLLEILTQ
jgi:uncharacterized protein YfeS